MENTIRIAVIGDFEANRPSHSATQEALEHSADALASHIDIQWIPTQQLKDHFNENRLDRFDGIFGAPGVPKSSTGLVNAIQFAREDNIPYLGT